MITKFIKKQTHVNLVFLLLLTNILCNCVPKKVKVKTSRADSQATEGIIPKKSNSESRTSLADSGPFETSNSNTNTSANTTKANTAIAASSTSAVSSTGVTSSTSSTSATNVVTSTGSSTGSSTGTSTGASTGSTIFQQCGSIQGVVAQMNANDQNLYCHLLLPNPNIVGFRPNFNFFGMTSPTIYTVNETKCPTAWTKVGVDLPPVTCSTEYTQGISCQGLAGHGCGRDGTQDCQTACTNHSAYQTNIQIPGGIWSYLDFPDERPPMLKASYTSFCRCSQYAAGSSSCPWGTKCSAEFQEATPSTCEASTVTGVWCEAPR